MQHCKICKEEILGKGKNALYCHLCRVKTRLASIRKYNNSHKQEKSLWSKKKYLNNPEESKMRARAWAMEHKDFFSFYHTFYNLKNSEKLLTYNLKYETANRKMILTKKRVRYSLNRDEILERRRAHYSKNRDTLLIKQKIYNSQNRKPSTHFTLENAHDLRPTG